MPEVVVTLSDLLTYVGDRSRPIIEGEAAFKAGHIILCGLEGGDTHKIKSLCLQSSSLISKPHEISIMLSKEVKDWQCVCSCKAGMPGFCKHIVATLIYVNRNENLEVVSCTDVTQKWGKDKKGLEETHKAEPFKNFCHSLTKRQKVSFKSSKELDDANFALLSSGIADSSIATYIGRSLRPKHDVQVPSKNSNLLDSILNHRRKSQFLCDLKKKKNIESFTLRPCCLDIVKTLSLSAADILKVTTYEQGSSMWFKERILRITGSTCYSIFTFNKEDWENKSKKLFFPKHFENKFTRHGKEYEKEALEVFSNKNNFEVVTPGLIASEAFPWLGYSADGIIFDENVPSKLLEIKCPYIGKEKSPDSFLENCPYLEADVAGIKLKESHSYYGQIQLGMGLLGLEETVFILYSSFTKTFLEVKIKFNQEFRENLILKITKNYLEKMLHFYCENKG